MRILFCCFILILLPLQTLASYLTYADLESLQGQRKRCEAFVEDLKPVVERLEKGGKIDSAFVRRVEHLVRDYPAIDQKIWELHEKLATTEIDFETANSFVDDLGRLVATIAVCANTRMPRLFDLLKKNEPKAFDHKKNLSLMKKFFKRVTVGVVPPILYGVSQAIYVRVTDTKELKDSDAVEARGLLKSVPQRFSELKAPDPKKASKEELKTYFEKLQAALVYENDSESQFKKAVEAFAK